MRLPRDRNDWHELHLRRAEHELANAFDRYERIYDAERPERTIELYRDVQRREALVADLRRVVGGK